MHHAGAPKHVPSAAGDSAGLPGHFERPGRGGQHGDSASSQLSWIYLASRPRVRDGEFELEANDVDDRFRVVLRRAQELPAPKAAYIYLFERKGRERFEDPYSFVGFYMVLC